MSYPGFCNVVKVYVNAKNDVYGSEISCTDSMGITILGSITGDGTVVASQSYKGTPCVFIFRTNGSLRSGCSLGGPISYSTDGTYVVRQDVGSVPPPTASVSFTVSTEMPDLEKTKNLPPLH